VVFGGLKNTFKFFAIKPVFIKNDCVNIKINVYHVRVNRIYVYRINAYFLKYPVVNKRVVI